MRQRDAESFLRRNGASQLGSACFVSPNATCPVCKASVFFYSNANGSRVFFDQLGPPWPKHPCTDRPTVSLRVAVAGTRPSRRNIGTIKDILIQSRVLDPRPVPTIGENENPKLNSWRLIVVNSLKSKNGIVEIDAEFVETIFNHKITLTAQDGQKLYVGQFASLCDEYLSFIDEDTGTRCDIQVWYKGLKPSGKVNENQPRSTKDQASSTTNATPTLDAFGIAAKLKTEGLPTPRLRSNYAVSNEQQPLFDNLK